MFIKALAWLETQVFARLNVCFEHLTGEFITEPHSSAFQLSRTNCCKRFRPKRRCVSVQEISFSAVLRAASCQCEFEQLNIRLYNEQFAYIARGTPS